VFGCQGVVPFEQNIVIFGASVRAAAFSALRAGLRPWCADLFADEDLRARCSINQVSPRAYPMGFGAISDNGPPGPWMYTGGLENHPSLVKRISEKRPLWGNNADALTLARSPSFLEEVFRSNEICFPRNFTSSRMLPRTSRWLSKPLRGAGGAGIQWAVASGQGPVARKGKKDLALAPAPNHRPLATNHYYFQEFIEGLPCSAVFVGFDKNARLLGATQQLVGETWLNASRFHYCGSIGPLILESGVQKNLKKIGNILNRDCHLRGLFGADFVLADGIPWPVEVNPRYPASVEILECAGIQALALHRSAFDSSAPKTSEVSKASEVIESYCGKAILFSDRPLRFPIEGPWTGSLGGSNSIDKMPDFADIPAAGSAINAHRPILTFFSRSDSVEGCIENLRHIALDLDHRLRMT